MQVHIVTIFPEMFPPALATGVIGRACKAGLADVRVHDLRSFTHDRHRSVDDSPFGGGPGMVMRPEPWFEVMESLALPPGAPVIMLTPQGKTFTQANAERLSREPAIALICGRYEGIDERVRQFLATEEISIGDYVLTGGELPALIVTDAVLRLLPGALGHGEEALADDSHTSGLLQYPQYTRPADFRGWTVPEVLLSGDHAAIARWRRTEALRRTLERRPDLLAKMALSKEDRAILEKLGCAGPS